MKGLTQCTEPDRSVHPAARGQELCEAGEALLFLFAAVMPFQSLNFQTALELQLQEHQPCDGKLTDKELRTMFQTSQTQLY